MWPILNLNSIGLGKIRLGAFITICLLNLAVLPVVYAVPVAPPVTETHAASNCKTTFTAPIFVLNQTLDESKTSPFRVQLLLLEEDHDLNLYEIRTNISPNPVQIDPNAPIPMAIYLKVKDTQTPDAFKIIEDDIIVDVFAPEEPHLVTLAPQQSTMRTLNLSLFRTFPMGQHRYELDYMLINNHTAQNPAAIPDSVNLPFTWNRTGESAERRKRVKSFGLPE